MEQMSHLSLNRDSDPPDTRRACGGNTAWGGILISGLLSGAIPERRISWCWCGHSVIGGLPNPP